MWLYKMCMQILNTEAQKYKGEHVVECKHSELDEGYFWTAVGHENISVIHGTTMEEAKIIKKWSDTVQLIFFPQRRSAQLSYDIFEFTCVPLAIIQLSSAVKSV